MSFRFTSTCSQGQSMEGSERRAMEETSPLARSMGNHGQVTLQNTFCISSFAGFTKHPTHSPPEQLRFSYS